MTSDHATCVTLALAVCLVADDNIVFVGYSAWRSHEDFWAAARSKDAEKWLEFLGDKGIVAVTRKLWTVPSRHP